MGKTTTSVNLAASLVATRRRVLLVDLDPQGNATMGSGVDKSALSATTCEVLLGESEAPSWLVDGLDDLLSDVRLEIPGLPDGLRPTRLAVTEDALQVRLEGTDVELLTLLE